MKFKSLKKYKEAYTGFVSILVALFLIALATYAWYTIGGSATTADFIQITAVGNDKVSAKLYVNDSPTPQIGPFTFSDIIPEETISFRLEIENTVGVDKSISVTFTNVSNITSNPPCFLLNKLYLYDLSAKVDGVAAELPYLTGNGFLSDLIGSNNYFSFLSQAIINPDETINIYFKIKLDATAGNGYRDLTARIGGISIITGAV